MYKGNAAVLDVGSSKLTALVGSRGVNGTFSVKAVKSAKYSGFENGVFFDVAKLKEIVINLISSIENNYGKKINELYIGVPGDFVLVKSKISQKGFARRKKIGERDIIRLISTLLDEQIDNYSHIDTASAYYIINGFSKTVYPQGQTADSIEAQVCHFFCHNDFLNIFKDILIEAGIKNLNFIAVSLAQALYLLPPEIRDEGVYLTDIGYISSTFSEVNGNGITFQKSFSRGCGHIAAYLSQAHDIDFDLAELLLSQSNLGFNAKVKADYEVAYADELYKFPIAETNSIIEYGLDEICEYLSACIEGSSGKADILYITGGGVYTIRGGLEYMMRRLNINAELSAPMLPSFNKPPHSSLISLLDAALFKKEKKIF